MESKGTAKINGQVHNLIDGSVNNTPQSVKRSGKTIEVNWTMELVFSDNVRDLEPAAMKVLELEVTLDGIVYTGKAVVNEINVSYSGSNQTSRATATFYGIGQLKGVDDMR